MFKVETEVFSGPLDLLLSLIQKNKLDICEISISKIADEFLEIVSKAKFEDPEMISDFIYISGKLIEIKSRYMLYIKTEDDEIEELVFSLEEYARYKEISQFLRDRYAQDYMYFEKIPEEIFIKQELDLSKLTLENIVEIARKRNKEEQIQVKYAKRQKSLSKKIRYIQDFVNVAKRCNFSDIVTQDDKDEKIVSILGVLHLVKENEIRARQYRNFDNILLEKNENINKMYE
ncbi:ScpA/B protein [[Eubacterium] yurii subsp. margaretiae ATCC 43715]|nr:ScpA/B protein [[Eubacterium] yurii subsp. margaretiae ATCC 43715]